MELSQREFNAMNRPFRRFLQRKVEYPIFREFGCAVRGKTVLEIGCGSGYGASLLFEEEPARYTGIDLMPEQIELAVKRNLPRAKFFVHDAARLDFLEDGSVDVIIDFGILHHIPEWKMVLAECFRVLKPGGELYIDEPDGQALAGWDRIFHWGHPGEEAAFSFPIFEEALRATGFSVERSKRITLFKFYKAVARPDGRKKIRGKGGEKND